MLSNDQLIKAIKILGSRGNLIRALNISRQRLNGWLNDGKSMGYEYAIALEYLTQGEVKAEQLLPQRAQTLKKLKINVNPAINDFFVKKFLTLNVHQSSNLKENLIHSSSISERILMGLLLENLLLCYQNRKRCKEKKYDSHFLKHLKDFIVESIDISSPTFYKHAKRVVKYGCLNLVNAMNDKHISVFFASQIANFSYKDQERYLEEKIKLKAHLHHRTKEMAYLEKYVFALLSQKGNGA
ncbi:MAG TPA: YdaS family helix-turn-helix protein [Gammaproteobacteria bacterium]|jgi:DNA-binding transcriptional regulator YdaS (Cro superfamily)|nr:YdaS family helix-turn-helix protein [Gammaproteobacteria bacterium]